jgi:hypothetical protein
MEKSQCIHEVWPKVKASGFSKLPSRKMMECGSGGRRNLFFSCFGYFISVVVDNGRGRKIVVLIEFGFRFHFKCSVVNRGLRNVRIRHHSALCSSTTNSGKITVIFENVEIPRN